MKRTKRSAYLRCTGNDRTQHHGVPATYRDAYYASVKARLTRMYPTATKKVGTTDEFAPADEAQGKQP